MAVKEFYFFGSYNSCPIEAITYLNASGITDPAIRDNYCKFVQELKDNGVYSLIDVLYPDLGSDASQNKLNAINPVDSDGAFRRTFSGGVTFDPVTGTKGNGTNGYYDTKYLHNNFNLLSGGGITLAIGSESTKTDDEVDIGAVEASGGFQIISKYMGDSYLLASATYEYVVTPNLSSIGIYSAFREPGNLTSFYGVSRGLVGQAVAGTVFLSRGIFGLCRSNNGDPLLFSSKSQQGVVIYKNATLSDVTKIETALQNMNARR